MYIYLIHWKPQVHPDASNSNPVPQVHSHSLFSVTLFSYNETLSPMVSATPLTDALLTPLLSPQQPNRML